MKFKVLFCWHEWENERELEWYGNMLVECSRVKCRKCGKTTKDVWKQIGGCK